MKFKGIIVVLVSVLFVAITIAGALAVLPEYSVELGNDFVNQSGDVRLRGVVFENENCWRYVRLGFPDEFIINMPVVGSVVGVSSWGSDLTVVNPNELSMGIGSIFVNGNSLVFYRDVLDDCVESSNASNAIGEIMFFSNFIVNPGVDGAFFVRANVTLANDNVVHNLSDELLFVRSYYSNNYLNFTSNYFNDYNIVNVSNVQVWNGSNYINVSVGDFITNVSNYITLENNVSNVFSLLTNISININSSDVSNINITNFISSLMNLSVFVNTTNLVNVNVTNVYSSNDNLVVNISSPVDISSFENTTLVFYNNFSNPFNITLDIGGINSDAFFNLSQAFYNNFSFSNVINVTAVTNVNVSCGNTSVVCPSMPESNDGVWVCVGLVICGLLVGAVLLFKHFVPSKFGKVRGNSPLPVEGVAKPMPETKKFNVEEPKSEDESVNIDFVDEEVAELSQIK